jgi:hypothetical protein
MKIGFYSLGGLALIIAGGFAIYWLRKRFDFRSFLHIRSKRKKAHASVEFYKKLIELFAARGINKPASMTPIEFAEKLSNEDALAITWLYNKVRFGGHKLTAQESKDIEERLGRIKNQG